MIKKIACKLQRRRGADSLFDVDFYLRANPDVAGGGQDPFTHYMTSGWREGRDPSPTFSTLYYKDKHLAALQTSVNPLTHYSTLSAEERRNTPTYPTTDFI